MMMNRDLKEKIRRLNPIQEVVNEFVPLKKNQGRCPKHTDKNPSFTVDPKLQIAKCWAGCTANLSFSNRDGSLDVFGFIQWIFNCNFSKAINRLAQRVGIQTEHSQSKNYKRNPDEDIRDFLAWEDIRCRRRKRSVLPEINNLHALFSQRLRKRAYKQYEQGVITKYGLERRLLALERTDEEFESIK